MNLKDFSTNKYSKKGLVSLFTDIVDNSSCMKMNIINDTGQFMCFEITDSLGKKYNVRVFFRNISNSGWDDKPEIKRIQIPCLEDVKLPTKNDFSLLCGIGKFDEEYMLAVWDPKNYLTHNTVCSCYVFFSSFIKAKDKGFYHGVNEGKEVMVCNANGFEDMIHEISSRYM